MSEALRPALRRLTALEARVLGVLVEKQHTVADSYPLSLHALVAGCNQKTSREPVMDAADADVLAAVEALKALSAVVEVSGSRVQRFEHNLGRVLRVPSQSVALLALLMLRGPQTAAELRLRTERLHRFADVSAVEGFLDELAADDPPKVVKLPRAPGSREPRWAQLLGPLTAPADFAAESGSQAGGADGALPDRLAALEAEVAALRGLVQRMGAALGWDDAGLHRADAASAATRSADDGPDRL